MKKLLFLFASIALLSCSKDDDCPNGKIKGHSTIQDRNFITLDNGREITIKASDFDLYPINSCYEGTK
ncbi:hypothetical protein [Flavobacterium faecale]|uniref:hypothetical protein n=1 Tax=Flavobacterium faecale TaxID=1355330 RepID=UPI003AAD0F4D